MCWYLADILSTVTVYFKVRLITFYKSLYRYLPGVTLSKIALGFTQPPIRWVPGLFLGDKAAGA